MNGHDDMQAQAEAPKSTHTHVPETPETGEGLNEVAILAEHEDGTQGWPPSPRSPSNILLRVDS